MRIFKVTVFLIALAVAGVAARGREADEAWYQDYRRVALVAPVLKETPIMMTNCSECELLVVFLQGLVNGSAYPRSQGWVREACVAKFGNGTSLDKICSDVGLLILVALQKLVVEGKEQAWEIPVTTCAAIGVCTRPCCLSNTAPEQLHISFASQQSVAGSTAIRASWVTLYATPGAAVQWRVTGATSWVTAAEAPTRTYTVGGWVGVIHSAVMTDLLPGTRYEYRVGPPGGVVSAVRPFSTLPLNAGTPARPLRIVTYGDMGYGPNSDANVARLTQLVDAGMVDMIVHHGDISYADADEYHWDLFGRKLDPVTSRVPYMTIPGNHEAPWNFTSYRTRMWMPKAGDGAPEDAMYYRFDVGHLSFVLLDSESPLNTPELKPAQMRWLEKQLAWADANNRTAIIHIHRPLYCSNHDSNNCGSKAAYLREAAEAIIDRHTSVRLVMQGHEHSYERTLPLAANFTRSSKSYDNAPFPTYIVSGAAGSREDYDHFNDKRPWFSPVRLLEFGVTQIDASRSAGEATLDISYVLQNNTIGDKFVLRTRY